MCREKEYCLDNYYGFNGYLIFFFHVYYKAWLGVQEEMGPLCCEAGCHWQRPTV